MSNNENQFETLKDLCISEGEGDPLQGMHNLIDVDELFETGSVTIRTPGRTWEVVLNVKEVK
jgi:hypothetical protein